MTVLTLLILAWFMGTEAVQNLDDPHHLAAGIFLSVLCVAFVVGAIVKHLWYGAQEEQDNDLPS
jgi:hypothetical protein